jgi:hypothetical protein
MEEVTQEEMHKAFSDNLKRHYASPLVWGLA